jgi:hypothetical protein
MGYVQMNASESNNTAHVQMNAPESNNTAHVQMNASESNNTAQNMNVRPIRYWTG